MFATDVRQVMNGIQTPVQVGFAESFSICNTRDIAGNTVESELHRGAYRQMDGDNRWRVIVCLRGVIWITQRSDLRDYVLKAGEAFIVTLPGTVVVQALEDASVRVTPSLQTTPYAGRLAGVAFP